MSWLLSPGSRNRAIRVPVRSHGILWTCSVLFVIPKWRIGLATMGQRKGAKTWVHSRYIRHIRSLLF